MLKISVRLKLNKDIMAFFTSNSWYILDSKGKFTPTKEQLKKLWFKKETENVYYLWDYGFRFLNCDNRFVIDIDFKQYNFYPESIEDLQTIIRVFKIK